MSRHANIAEKLHAYTMPRSRPNSRIKDLPDIAILASTGAIEAAMLRVALEKTFEFRVTHALPDDFPQPPTNWQEPYAAMAASNELIWGSLDELHRAVQAVLGPVLSRSTSGGNWSPSDWRWPFGT